MRLIENQSYLWSRTQANPTCCSRVSRVIIRVSKVSFWRLTASSLYWLLLMIVKGIGISVILLELKRIK